MKIKHHIIIILLGMLGSHAFSQESRNGYNSVLHQPPEADFSWDHACFGDTTTFINASIRANTYTWTIYNKSLTKIDSSNAVNISFYFPAIDTFYVRLDADNGHPASSYQMVIIDSALTADFSFMHCSNEFLSHSTCADSLHWDFGDGASSNSSFPVHQYADTGYYNVTLIAYKGNLSDTVTKQIFVDPQAFPTGATTWYLGHDTLFVHAVDSMAGMFYNWNFGMGIHMYKRDTFYILPDTGTYIINFGDWNTCATMYSSDTVRYYPAISGIASAHTFSSILLFPNPCTDYLNLTNVPSGLRNKQPIIFNLLNQRISDEYYQVRQTADGYGVDLQKIPRGVYYIRIPGEGTSFNSKFIVNRE